MNIAKKLAVTGGAVSLAVSGLTLAAASTASAQEGGDCTYASGEQTLSYGARGYVVMQIQCELNFSMSSKYPVLAIDGLWGPQTDARVRAFQTCVREYADPDVAVDGIVGPTTWAYLDNYAYRDSYVC